VKYFALEEPDRMVLNDPERYILGPGGVILMAYDGDRAVGCCALIPMEPGEYEVAKMAVAEDYRGSGIGRRLLEYTIAQARTLGARLLYLETNWKLANAVHLYESVGFRHLAAHEVTPSPYTRANVFMDLRLK
jgi:N-acetylglutamate synthase-like GNAT family acetyltransferase